jgi:hypothetical protein
VALLRYRLPNMIEPTRVLILSLLARCFRKESRQIGPPLEMIGSDPGPSPATQALFEKAVAKSHLATKGQGQAGNVALFRRRIFHARVQSSSTSDVNHDARHLFDATGCRTEQVSLRPIGLPGIFNLRLRSVIPAAGEKWFDFGSRS